MHALIAPNAMADVADHDQDFLILLRSAVLRKRMNFLRFNQLKD